MFVVIVGFERAAALRLSERKKRGREKRTWREAQNADIPSPRKNHCPPTLRFLSCNKDAII